LEETSLEKCDKNLVLDVSVIFAQARVSESLPDNFAVFVVAEAAMATDFGFVSVVTRNGAEVEDAVDIVTVTEV
jgi:hypothetical protein